MGRSSVIAGLDDHPEDLGPSTPGRATRLARASLGALAIPDPATVISYPEGTAMAFLEDYDRIPEDRPQERVALVSRLIRTADWRPFFKELRESRPIFRTPAFT